MLITAEVVALLSPTTMHGARVITVDLEKLVAAAAAAGPVPQHLLELQAEKQAHDQKRHAENVAWDDWRDSLAEKSGDQT